MTSGGGDCVAAGAGAGGGTCAAAGGAGGTTGTGAAVTGATGAAVEDGEAAPSGGNCPSDAASGVTREVSFAEDAADEFSATLSVPPAVSPRGILFSLSSIPDIWGSTVPPLVSVSSCPTRSLISFSIATRRVIDGITVSKSFFIDCTASSSLRKRASSFPICSANNGVNFNPSGGASARKVSIADGACGCVLSAVVGAGGGALPPVSGPLNEQAERAIPMNAADANSLRPRKDKIILHAANGFIATLLR